MRAHLNQPESRKLIQNVRSKLALVKGIVSKILPKPRGVLLLGVLFACTLPAAKAEDANAKAVLNATYLTTMLHGVVPSQLLVMVEKIANGKTSRPAPDQPVWILETISGTILYYQGQPEFAQKPAAQLVDDNGIRFGMRAIEQGKASKSSWSTIALGGKSYRAYCASQYPTVVCSLVIQRR